MMLSKLTYFSFLLIAIWSCRQQPAANQQETDIESCLYSYKPMPMDTANSLQYNWDHKKIIESKVVDDMESMDHWITKVGSGSDRFAKISLSSQHFFEGKHAILFKSATSLNIPLKTDQRFWEWQFLTRQFDQEDFSSFNRISVKIFPDCPGHQKIHLMMILNNEGNVPDKYFREGIHTFMLENNKWNNVVFEVSHLPRNKVTGISIVYRQQGNELNASDTVNFYIDRLAWERVDPDHFEGWDTHNEISFSHTGYNVSASKTAVTSARGGQSFKLVSVPDNKVVLEKDVLRTTSVIGDFTVFDFSEIDKEGSYRIQYDGHESKVFSIQQDVWKKTVLKTLNLFFCERCGYELPGIHQNCHSDWHTVDNGDTVRLNGGWHDAGDLSQSYLNTAEAVGAMFRLARKYKNEDTRLYDRLIQEAKWGLKWMHKNRFGAGKKVNWTVIDNWSDGIIGNRDDKISYSSLQFDNNYYSIVADVEAAKSLSEQDPQLAKICLQYANEDWLIAEKSIADWNTENLSLAVWSGSLLYEVSNNEKLLLSVLNHADQLMACQQKNPLKWEKPFGGFFYKEYGSDIPFGYNHHVRVISPVLGLVELCRIFPNQKQFNDWHKSVKEYAGYLKSTASLTAPYYMLPAGIYKLGTDQNEQITNGIQLDENHYLRMFPVWGPFRGNSSIILSHAIGLAYANKLLRDPEISKICQNQLEWIVGKNPFNQSLMYGEGYNFTPQYSVMCGDIVGGLPVGIQTNGDKDIPYWQPAVFCNYKEIWVHPSTRWLELLESIN